MIPKDYLTGKKDPAKISDKFLYQAFREKEKGSTNKKRKIIHKSLDYIVYTIDKDELFQYLKTPEGKKWLTTILKQQNKKAS